MLFSGIEVVRGSRKEESESSSMAIASEEPGRDEEEERPRQDHPFAFIADRKLTFVRLHERTHQEPRFLLLLAVAVAIALEFLLGGSGSARSGRTGISVHELAQVVKHQVVHVVSGDTAFADCVLWIGGGRG